MYFSCQHVFVVQLMMGTAHVEEENLILKSHLEGCRASTCSCITAECLSGIANLSDLRELASVSRMKRSLYIDCRAF